MLLSDRSTAVDERATVCAGVLRIRLWHSVSSLDFLEQNTGQSAMYIGELDTAETATEKAIALVREQLENDPENTAIVDRLAEMMTNQGAILSRRGGRQNDLIALNRNIAEKREQLLRVEPTNVFWRNKLAEVYRHLYLSLGQVGDTRGAAVAARRAVATREPLAFLEPMNAAWHQR